MRIGIFSMIFGLLYNSVFGLETVLPVTLLPVHKSSNIMYVLGAAVGFGIFLIIFCMVLNMINGVHQHNIGKVIFSSNGLAGLVFYVSVLIAGILMVGFKINIFSPVFIIVFLVLPLFLLLLAEPLTNLAQHRKEWMPKQKGMYFTQSFFELFETLLSYFSNTISFVRLGAFVLSHAGMMAAIFTLAKMAPVASPVILIIGNAVIIGLEGLVVGIQGIRLEFYEMFSRFYEGDGKPYQPAVVKYNN